VGSTIPIKSLEYISGNPEVYRGKGGVLVKEKLIREDEKEGPEAVEGKTTGGAGEGLEGKRRGGQGYGKRDSKVLQGKEPEPKEEGRPFEIERSGEGTEDYKR